jgi:hypothetical protein
MSRKTRRIVALVLLVLGGLLLFLAPQTWGGAVLMGLGVVIEVVGITLERLS